MGHLSVSRHSLSFLDMLLLDDVYFEVHLLFSLFFFFNKCANAVEATSSQITEPLEREFQLDLLKREARSLSGSYGAVLSQSKSLLKSRLCNNSHLNEFCCK